MISSDVKQKIERLFSEKKYEELIAIASHNIKPEERPPGLACMIGTCYFLKNKRSKNDLLASLKYFDEAYLKDNKSINGLAAVSNLMSISPLAARTSEEFIPYLLKAEKYYHETEKYFGQNVNFLIAAKKLFWFQLNHEIFKSISEKLNSNSKANFIEKYDGIFFQNYIYNWSQKEYSKNAVANSKNIPKYKIKNLEVLKLDDNEKIHLGFVGADFTDQHSIFYFLKDTLKYLDRKYFKVFLFSFKRNKNDFLLGQKEIKGVVDEYIDLENHNNEKCIDIIQEKKINILFDIMGLSFPKRISIFNNRVAPTQISWLATCNTNGIDNIDYLIADKNLISENEENNYPEKILKLPDIWNAHCGYNLERNFNISPCEKNNYFTFGSLNSFHKISDQVIEAWSKILIKCDNSKLILKSSTFNCNVENIKNKFQKFGVENKIEILNKKNYPYKKDHLGVYKNIDLALDTFPYNGVTTTFEALWMGVPVNVLKGFNFNSRCGYSIMKNSTFEDLISKNIDEYVEKAIYCYNNRAQFLELRSKIFKNILTTSLFDTKKFSNNFGQLLLGLKK